MKRVAELFDLRCLKARGLLSVENKALIDRKLCGSFGGQGIGECPAIGRNEPNE